MEQYIPKAALVAEIERRKQKLLDHIICESDKEWVVRTAHQLNRIILFLDTLEVKEVDLEKELDSMITLELKFHKALPSLFDVAKHFFELALSLKK